MTTYFISDLHLCAEHPAHYEKLRLWLENIAPRADALYILGDLFEYWVGDDIGSPLSAQVAILLANWQQNRNIPVYFMAGNRDFLLGSRFAHDAKWHVLGDPHVIELYGQRVLLSHGDLFCQHDSSYQRYRRLTRLVWLQRLFLLLPKRLRTRIANSLRKQSGKHTKTLDAKAMDVTSKAIEHAFEKYQADVIVHGHTHRPSIALNFAPKRAHFVMSDWENFGNSLHCDREKNWRLEYF